jgi:hypothetical protein
MFAGEHGWVLKPPGYRSDPTEPIQYKTLDLKITVFAGQHIPIPPHQTEKGFHPYIRCELHVEKQEERTGEPIEGGGRAKGGEHKRKTPWGKGDHPDFGPEGSLMDFPGIGKVVEELSFVRLVSFLVFLFAKFLFVSGNWKRGVSRLRKSRQSTSHCGRGTLRPHRHENRQPGYPDRAWTSSYSPSFSDTHSFLCRHENKRSDDPSCIRITAAVVKSPISHLTLSLYNFTAFCSTPPIMQRSSPSTILSKHHKLLLPFLPPFPLQVY